MTLSLQHATSVIELLQVALKEVSLEAPSAIAKSDSFRSWMGALRTYWDHHDTLDLGITPFHFWLGSVAWKEDTDDPEESFACWLYRAGLRGLSFTSEFPESQALWLVVLLGQWIRHRPGLDLVSLLWTRTFRGFSYSEYNPVDESVVWDGWELEEIVRGLYELQEHDPHQQWNFAQGPKRQPDDNGTYATSDSLQNALGEMFSESEKELVQELLFEEEQQIPMRASDLFLMVLMHCEKPEDIEPLASWLAPIATSLINNQMWYSLTFLVDDLQRMESQLPEAIQTYVNDMVEQLISLLCLPNNLTPVTKHLMQWSRLTQDERTGLTLYLQLLASFSTDILDDLAIMQDHQGREQLRSIMTHPIWEDEAFRGKSI